MYYKSPDDDDDDDDDDGVDNDMKMLIEDMQHLML